MNKTNYKPAVPGATQKTANNTYCQYTITGVSVRLMRYGRGGQ